MQKPLIVVVINTSWGAVDWILPALSHLKQEGVGDLVVYFKNEKHRRRGSEFQDLQTELERIAEVLDAGDLTSGLSFGEKLRVIRESFRHDWSVKSRLWKTYGDAALRAASLLGKKRLWQSSRIPDPLIAALLRDRFQDRPVACLMQDFAGRYDEAFHQTFPEAGKVIFPHGTNWWDESTRLESRFQQAMQDMSPATIWLTGWAQDEKFFRHHGVRGRIVPCGQPKFDPEWIKQVQSRRLAVDKKQSLTMLFLSRPLRKTTNVDRSRQNVESVFRVAARHGLRVHVKLHPNQSAKEIEPLLRKAGLADRQWRQVSVLAAAPDADFVVSLPSSAVMDAGAMGVPSFEFFAYADQWYASFVKDGEKATSIYRQRGLVEPVDDEQSLHEWVERISQDPGLLRKLAARQTTALRQLLPCREGAIEKAVAAVREAIETAPCASKGASRHAA